MSVEESLLQSNFVGRDGFRWWIGQIAPESSQSDQINGAGWGNRFKVRIMGYHSFDPLELANEDLPWAQVLLPSTSGSGGGNQAQSVALSPGDSVLGFFLDGDNAQVPTILGHFGRTFSVSNQDYRRPFVPYTGYTEKIKNDGSYILNDQTNEQNASSQKSPRNVPDKLAKKIGSNERSSFTGIGDVIVSGNGSEVSTVLKMTTTIDNFVNRITTLTTDAQNAVGYVKDLVDYEIEKITSSLQKQTTGIVNTMINSLYEKLAPILNAGLKLLYRTVYATVFAATQNHTIAHLAGVAAQKAMVAPVNLLKNQLPCIANKIINGLFDTVKDILKSVAENVKNFVTCIGEQVVASLMNHIIGNITNLISPFLQNLDKILIGFSIIDFLRGNAEGLLNLTSNLSCEEIGANYNSPTNQWVIGKGPKEITTFTAQKILETANAADAIATSFLDAGQALSSLSGSLGIFDFMNPSVSIPGFTSGLGDCYAGIPFSCGPVKVKIFGSNGFGAEASAIIGSIVGEGAEASGSVIGYNILNGGQDYDFPPFIEIVDECNNGYGAVARAIVDYNEDSPTYKQVVSIYPVSEGENYPVGDSTSYVIDNITIIDPGTGYTANDQVIVTIDSNVNPATISVGSNTPSAPSGTPTTPGTPIINTNKTTLPPFNVKVGPNGEIISILSLDSNITSLQIANSLPEITISTQTGSGAILKPKFKVIPEYQGKVLEQIDCITK